MDFTWSLQIALTGMLVVFITLIILQGLLEIPQFMVRLGNKKNQKASELSPIINNPEEIPAQHLVIIAAAVSMMGDSYRIKTIEVCGNENWERSRYTEINTL